MLKINRRQQWLSASRDGSTAVTGVCLAMLLAVGARLPFLELPAYPDEGGYLLVAEHWAANGPWLYGPLWVDRPPLLIGFWRVADVLGGIEASRMLACLVVAVLVAAAGWAGALLAGPRGAYWAAFVAAALSATPILGALEIDGEILASPLVLLSCAAALMSIGPLSGSTTKIGWAMASGLTGAAAVLVKQNLVDGLAFAVTLLLVSVLRGRISVRLGVQLLVAGAAGVSIPVASTIAWAATTKVGAAGLWQSLYGFRSTASQVIATHSRAAPDARLLLLLGVAVASGLFIVAGAYVWMLRRQARVGDPVTIAVFVMLFVGVAGVALGGSYWLHYLIGLIPAVSLAAAVLATRIDHRAATRAAVAVVVASSAAATMVVAVAAPFSPPRADMVVSGLLRAAGRPSDTVAVAYGQANIIQTSGLHPAYPYLWSLPTRTLDPNLNLMVLGVTGKSAATWVVVWLPLNSWGIDADGRLSAAVATNYRQVSAVCGVRVYLRRDQERTVPAGPGRCG